MPATRDLLVPSLVALVVLVLWRLAMAWLLPVVQDEAYYLEWARALDFGYFDHPPGVAWIGVTTHLKDASAFAGRVGAIVASIAVIPFLVNLVRLAGITDRRTAIAALILVLFNCTALLSGAITTPDALMVPAWCVALHEAAAALRGKRARWITAGVAAGVGLLAKYIMVLIGPVFLWALIAGDRRALRTPWPYLGALAGLLVFGPHLAWNAANEWTPIRMQMHHGFEDGHDPGFTVPSDLPEATLPEPGGPELELARSFGGALPAPGPEKSRFVEILQNTTGYLGSLLLMWGAFVAPLVHRFILALRGRVPPEAPLDARVRPLLVAATWVPVLFWGAMSFVTQIESNWPSVYVFGGALLLAGFGASRVRALVVLAGVNLLILLAGAIYAHAPIDTGASNRILKETRGWREFAAWVEADARERGETTVFVGREQNISMLRFHTDLTVVQWPGVNQPSEYERRPEWNEPRREALEARGRFTLILDAPLPPHIEGWTPVDMIALWCCADGALTERRAGEPAPCPDAWIHIWHVVRYERRSG